MKHLVFLAVMVLIWIFLTVSVHSQTQSPVVVNIGAIFTYNSVIGRAAKIAMEAAVSDVNEDPGILNGTKLQLVMEDANCSVFLGAVGGTIEFVHCIFHLKHNRARCLGGRKLELLTIILI